MFAYAKTLFGLTLRLFSGFSQGIRRSVGGLATILGPLWAGGLTSDLYVMMGLMMGLLAILTVSPNVHMSLFGHVKV